MITRQKNAKEKKESEEVGLYTEDSHPDNKNRMEDIDPRFAGLTHAAAEQRNARTRNLLDTQRKSLTEADVVVDAEKDLRQSKLTSIEDRYLEKEWKCAMDVP